MRKYVPYICMIGAIVVITISILFNNSKNKDNFIYYYNSYNLTSLVNSDDYLNVNIFVNNKKSYFIDKKQIANCIIESDEETLDIDIIKITDLNQTIVYNNGDYYSYIFKFKIKFNTTNYASWFIKNAKLIIRYNNNFEYILKIGDISINKIEKNNEIISLSNVKPLTSIVNKNTYLTGLIIGVRKTTNYNVSLKKISLLDANLSVGNRIETLKELPMTNRFDDVANYNYSSVIKGIEEIDIKISDDIIYLFIPIYYNRMTISNKFPISLELTVNNAVEKYILSDYIFYEPSNYIVHENEIVLCEIK